jgi:hypothetical protein
MRDTGVRTIARLIGLAAALGVAGCSTSVIDIESFRTPDASIFTPRSVSGFKQSELKPVTAEDLVDAGGNCAAPVAATPLPVSPDGPSAPAAVPAIPGGIALEMTECEVVQRVGQPAQVQIGSNARNERTAALIFSSGDRAGTYHFVSGRLRSMERAPELSAPPKPVRKAKPKAKPKPKTATAN